MPPIYREVSLSCDGRPSNVQINKQPLDATSMSARAKNQTSGFPLHALTIRNLLGQRC